MLHRNILALLLLMMTGAALADTKTLYFMGATFNNYCIGSHTGTLFKTPQQAQRTCGFKDYDLVGPSANGDYGLAKNGTTWFSIYAKTQSCELKDVLSHNGDKIFTLNLPYSEKGAPKMFRRCVNNCEREFRRIRKMGESANTEESGSLCVESPNPNMSSFCTSSYTVIQTGAVCTLKPEGKDDTQYDDVTANPGDDNGNGADGKGMDGDGGKNGSDNPGKPPKQDGRDDNKTDNGTSGSDGSGNQNGGQGGTGADSPRDSGSADEPVEDKDKNKDKDKPGKGKGKGGGGGGNHGDKDKDDKDKADDDKGGDPKGGEGKGDGKGDGKDGGKDGKDKEDGSPNGTDNGTGAGGDKDGQGSGISGGDCKSGKAPSCKGDPVQCYIAREQWRTACLAERGGGSVSGGSCKNNQPPECKGDPTQCYIVKQQFYQGCEAARAQQERDGMKDYVGGKGGVVAEVDGSSMDGVGKTLAGNSREQNITDILDLGGYGWSRSCPAITAVDMGKWGRFELDGAPYCTIANLIGNILVALSLLFSVRYMFA